MSNQTRLSLLDDLQSDRSDEAWKHFCEVYEDLIEGWLMSQGLQAADADDIRQEVLSAVHQEISSFRHNGRTGAFRCWLRRIVSNRLHRLWERKSKNERQIARVDLSSIAEQLADDSSRLSAAWDRDHNALVLTKLLNLVGKRFNENHMAAFQRLTINDEEPRKVARELEMTLGAVRVAQHRVLKELRRIAGAIIE